MLVAACAIALRAEPIIAGASQLTSWAPALPGYRFSFPADFGAHENARNEWWYYTGNLHDAAGRRFGFEITIFRLGVQHPVRGGSAWDINDLYVGHFAITDVAGKRFLFFDRASRGALGEAGAATGNEHAWIGDWATERLESGDRVLHARAAGAGLWLHLRPAQFAIHGQAGVSRKGSCRTCASHYYSFPRLQARGVLVLAGRRHNVSGLAWNDHEWGSDELQPGVVGWDWFSIQLEDGDDIMLYRLRRADGSSIPESSGTLVPARGAARYLPASDFSIAATAAWTSPHDGARYPAKWTIALPRYRMVLNVTPVSPDQELLTTHSGHVAYWEGACDISGTAAKKHVRGVGYTELTGYASGPLSGLR